jgi:hypothetical protein
MRRHNRTSADSDRSRERAAAIHTLIESVKLNGVEPQAWLTDVLKRMVSGRAKAHALERLLP